MPRCSATARSAGCSSERPHERRDEPCANRRSPLAAALRRQRHRRQRFRGRARADSRVGRLGAELAGASARCTRRSAATPKRTADWCRRRPRISEPRGATTSASSCGSRIPRCTRRCATRRSPCTARTLRHLDPPAERLEIPFEGHIIPGHLRCPRGVDHSPARAHRARVSTPPRRRCSPSRTSSCGAGWRLCAIDGPGQSENSVHFRDPSQLGDRDHTGARSSPDARSRLRSSGSSD